MTLETRQMEDPSILDIDKAQNKHKTWPKVKVTPFQKSVDQHVGQNCCQLTFDLAVGWSQFVSVKGLFILQAATPISR